MGIILPYKSRSPWRPKPFSLNGHSKSAGLLHNTLLGRPMIVMGNAYSLTYQDMEKLTHFKVMGCNRCLRPDFAAPAPDYYTCVDRDPYAQELERIRAFKGIKLLSGTLFDPNVISKRTHYRPNAQPRQPLPDFEWHYFRAVSGIRADIRACRGITRTRAVGHPETPGWLPMPQLNLTQAVINGANIATLMLQLAVALGANPIGICGVDMAWESKDKSHAFGGGNGSKAGAFSLNPRHTMPFFEAIAQGAYNNGAKIYNLSPIGILSPLFERISEVEFYNRFGEYTAGDRLCTRQQLELKQPQLGRHRFYAANPGGKSHTKKVRRKPPPRRGPPSPSGRAYARKREEARQALVTRRALARKRKNRSRP